MGTATMQHDPIPRSAHELSYLRLSITNDCDLGCLYCAPCRRSLDYSNAPLSLEEITKIVRAFALNGVNKVRLTGGEPLVREDVVAIAESIASIPGIQTLGLTTNGTHLAELAGDLKRAGVSRINISLDSLNRETYREITGRDALESVIKGLHVALDAGFERVKINAVVMQGINHDEVQALAELTRSLPVDVRFIELMPLWHTSEQWEKLYFPTSKIRLLIGELLPVSFDGVASARMYTFPDGKGRVGFISPMSEHFCTDCNRIRVTASGRLKPCLRLPVEYDIRYLLAKPDIADVLSDLIASMNNQKLSGTSTDTPTIQAETMCSIGG